MIIRIMTEGQYNLPGAFIDDLNELDNKLVEVVEREDREQFEITLKEMLDLVREKGTEVPVDELVESDLVLPALTSRSKRPKTSSSARDLCPDRVV